jgi:hypothetical protein
MRTKRTNVRTNISRKTHKYTVDEFKTQLNLSHSEELFDIEAEIPYQCSRIDSFIADVEIMREHLNRMNNLIDNNEDNKNAIYIQRECNVLKEYELVMKETYEELRTACEKLRSRGEGWKRLARNLFDETPDNKRFIADKFKK